jgi:Domain of unknown function (DUF4421)
MRNLKIIFLLTLVLPCFANAQYYNKKYIRDLRYRLLLSYFQEYRSVGFNVNPDKKFDSTGKENLGLSSSANLYSGLLIQTNNASLYLASTTPQTDVDIKKFGKQSSGLFKIAFVKNSIATSLSCIKSEGLYDKNYTLHPEFAGDTVAYRRYNGAKVTWINFDINYYKNHRQFAIGMPTYFGLRQLKSKFSLGGRFSFNQLSIDNKGNSFFRDTLTKKFADFAVSKFKYTGVNLSLTPSVHVVAFKKLFLYADLSLGVDIGNVKSSLQNKTDSKFYVNAAIAQAKTIVGYHTDRFITSIYYTFINQSFKTNQFIAGATYNNFGFIIGYRINLYKNLPWQKN